MWHSLPAIWSYIMKIIDKINHAIQSKKTFFSFEYFTPKTKEGVLNLYNRVERMAALEPAFVDVTWGAGGKTSKLSVEISGAVQKYYGLEVMMHLTCTNMSKAKLSETLEKVKDTGITNILALRGDPPIGAKNWEKCDGGFSYASDLVKFIRDEYGDYFGIGVAGYPEGHLESQDKATDIKYLKEKVDVGADFIITQLFFDVNEYISFFQRCREADIQCPIIPGLMPIQTYSGFKRMTGFCQTKVPQEIIDTLEPIQSDDAAIKEYGVQLCLEMSQKLLDNGAPGVHFYTLNLEKSTTRIIEELRLVSASQSRRALPWRPSTLPSRSQEDVRPIFWSNRPKSYIARTMDWDDFPNGRWGDSHSPAFGDLKDYYVVHHGLEARAKKENRQEMWGENPSSVDDIAAAFVRFCEGKIVRLPWCETPIQKETLSIMEELIDINRRGFLTINSQPQVNAVPSSDPKVGWGMPGGYIYQKAYIEFFVSEENLRHLLGCIDQFSSLTYHAVNVEGKTYSNGGDRYVNAVTWGVFPGREISQPTVVDSHSFMTWKDEAFQLWLDEWASLYQEDSLSHKLISEIYEGYYLMSLVENDYINGNIFEIFEKLAIPQKMSS